MFVRRSHPLNALLMVLALALASHRCAAQYLYTNLEPRPDHTCTLHGGGNFVFPKGSYGGGYQSGGGFQAGGGFAVTPSQTPRTRPVLFLTLDFAFSHHDAESVTSKTSGTAASTPPPGNFTALTFDPQVRYYLTHRISLYGIGGFGLLRRDGTETIPSSPTSTNPGGPATTKNVAVDSGVADFGGGVNVGLRERGGLVVFVESRYYKGLTINHDLNPVSISAGFRW